MGCHKIVFSDILHFTGLEPKFYHRSIKWIVRMGYNIIEDYSLGITTAFVKIVLSHFMKKSLMSAIKPKKPSLLLDVVG